MAVWPLTGAIFLGRNERGLPFRLRYFQGALTPGPPG